LKCTAAGGQGEFQLVQWTDLVACSEQSMLYAKSNNIVIRTCSSVLTQFFPYPVTSERCETFPAACPFVLRNIAVLGMLQCCSNDIVCVRAHDWTIGAQACTQQGCLYMSSAAAQYCTSYVLRPACIPALLGTRHGSIISSAKPQKSPSLVASAAARNTKLATATAFGYVCPSQGVAVQRSTR
jgi:hypothetical protein